SGAAPRPLLAPIGAPSPAIPATDLWLRTTALLADAVLSGGGAAAADSAHRVLRDLHLARTSGWATEATLLALLTLSRSERAEAAAAWCDRFLADSDPSVPGAAVVARAQLAPIGLAPIGLSPGRLAPGGVAAGPGDGNNGGAPMTWAATAQLGALMPAPAPGQLAAPAGGQTTRAVVIAARAAVALDQGDLPLAVEHARTALSILPAKAWGVAVGLPLGTLILATTRMGDVEEAARHLVQTVPDEMFSSRYGLDYLYARGQHHLATHHAHAALADFLACGELSRGWGVDAAGLVPWRTGAAAAWLQLGNVEAARQLAQEQLTRASAPRVRGLALRLLAAASPAGRRLPLLTESLDLLEAAGDRLEQAHTLADLSRAYDTVDQRRRARLLLRRALHVATMCAARPLSQELFAISGDNRAAPSDGAGREEIAALTDSERRVASLAVMGYTNREIASRLYVTPSTVEQHLTRVYRKLNVKRRRDLPVDLWTDATRTG
ncbi:helix-turn-helix transcriptional regulator, partial [Parafrankia sp. EUN1f]|uniref:helix-turn-helix transcriptional regulator n=1 Tax=Parafrankia sp. EUN1f TaxID=102897 RepID=UPI0001C438F0